MPVLQINYSGLAPLDSIPHGVGNTLPFSIGFWIYLLTHLAGERLSVIFQAAPGLESVLGLCSIKFPERRPVIVVNGVMLEFGETRTMPLSTWVHCAWTKGAGSSGVLRQYLDGTASPISDPASGVSLGAFAHGLIGYMTGLYSMPGGDPEGRGHFRLADLFFAPVELTPSQIYAISRGTVRPSSFAGSCFCYYPFENPTTGIVVNGDPGLDNHGLYLADPSAYRQTIALSDLGFSEWVGEEGPPYRPASDRMLRPNRKRPADQNRPAELRPGPWV